MTFCIDGLNSARSIRALGLGGTEVVVNIGADEVLTLRELRRQLAVSVGVPAAHLALVSSAGSVCREE